MKPTTGYLSLVRVRFGECDPMGHLNNASYLTYLEQVAFDHAASAGFDRLTLSETTGAMFVVRKHEITYHQPAYEDDWLLISTWATELRGARAYRSYTVSKYSGPRDGWQDRAISFAEMPVISRQDLVISASTEFAFMNVTTGRPTRIPQGLIDAFANTSA